MYDYFDIQAKVGITKHMGGLKATKELLDLCGVDDSHYVLVVGSGNGVSAVKMHRWTGCRVVGIDLSPDMVKSARERWKRVWSSWWEMRRIFPSMITPLTWLYQNQ